MSRHLRLLFTDRNCGESPAPLHLGAALAAGAALSDDNDNSDAQTSVGCKPTAAPLVVDRHGADGEEAPDAWRLHATERNCRTSPQRDDEMAASKLSDQQADVAHLSSSFPSLGLNSRPADWTWCPELDHGAVVQFNSMMRKKGFSAAQQPCGHIDAPLSPPQSSAHCETPLPGSGHSVSTVTLRRRADESFGIHVEMTSHPLKVVVARLNPGGAAGKVRVHLFTSWQSGH